MIEISLLFLSALVFIALGIIACEVSLGNRRLTFLRDVSVTTPPRTKVSVIFSALNEELHIREAVTRLVNLDYVDYEVIAINDRSTDRTGAILDELARVNPRLTVIHIQKLPPGWLGKNHALHFAALKARGEIFLFTDADILFEPTALSKAIYYLESHQIEHLSLLPDMIAHRWVMKMFVASFVGMFIAFFRPWRVKNPKSRAYMGVGAFNLLQKSTYFATGGFETIRLRPDDDLCLGRLVKARGFRSDVVIGMGMASVEWYPSLGAAFRGFEKNALCAFDYSFLGFIVGMVSSLYLYVFPFLGVWFVGFPANLFLLGGVIFILFLFWDAEPYCGVKWWNGFLFPLGIGIIAIGLVRAALLTLWRGGIDWRGTRYPLKELKTCKRPSFAKK